MDHIENIVLCTMHLQSAQSLSTEPIQVNSHAIVWSVAYFVVAQMDSGVAGGQQNLRYEDVLRIFTANVTEDAGSLR